MRRTAPCGVLVHLAGDRKMHLLLQFHYMIFWPAGDRRFVRSGRPRAAGKPSTKTRGFAPHCFGRFTGRPGPPRPPKSTTSARSKNHIPKNPQARSWLLAPEFLMTFLADRRSPIFRAWAAPSGRGNLEKERGEAPRLFAKLPGRPGPPRPPKSAISAWQKNQTFETQV